MIRTILALAMCLGSTFAMAQATLPSGTIRIVVPYPPGAITDTVPRLVAEKIKAESGQPVIMDNRPGAGGRVATEHVTRAAPDGNTLLVTLPDTVVIAPMIYSKLGYDPARDLRPIAMLAKASFVLVVRNDLPVNNLGELLAYAKANPGKLRSSSWGEGSAGHLALELMKSMADVDIMHVPYKGAQAAMVDLIGGQVDMMFTGYSTAGPYVKEGRLRIIGRTGAERSALTPDVPTLSESGIPGYDVQTWYGLMAPAKTPPETIEAIRQAVARAAATPEVQRRIADFFADPAVGTVDAFEAQLESDRKQWAAVIRRAKIQLD